MATIAPLSVHSLICGIRTSTPCLVSDLQQFSAQLGVRGEAAANDQGLRTVLLATAHRLLGEHRRDGIGQRRAHVVDGNLIAFRLLLLDPTRHGRLHAGETEIVRMLLPRLALCKALKAL